ncbi:hypothetical protein MTO96_026140 [Rhipicephalus appendiculatus]
MILQFTDALVNESSAVEVLAAWCKLQLPYEDLSKAGFQLTLDPFFRSLLLAMYRNVVGGPPIQDPHCAAGGSSPQHAGSGRHNGQAAVRRGVRAVHRDAQPARATPGTPERSVITGTVLVTKCPCLHPGDVRKFTAVDVPELHHVVDCIVFPAQGPRPHPDEMAGSDLDGDEYVVIWEKCLFFPGPNRTPMNFSDRNPEPDKKEITIEDMIQFICNYIKNDSIGVLSSAHLAWADQEQEGIHSQKCLDIAEKISVCLDFAKNGQLAFLRRDERPVFYPDFMEKGSHKTTYRSDRALGVLYRTCRSLEAAVGRLGLRHVDPGRCQALAVPGWEDYRESAMQALSDYNTNLRRILNQYGIGSEGEVMACMVSTFDTYHNAQTDKLNMEDLVGKMTSFLTVTTRDVFYKEVLEEMHESSVPNQAELRKRKLRRASAWYMVAYEHSVENTFFSFPWCIADVLVEILHAADAQEKVWCPNILHWKIDRLIENSDLAEDDGLDAGCDSFKTAFQIIEKWLKEETLLGQREPGAPSKPGLCSNCLLEIYTEFLGSKKLAPAGKIVTKRRHAMMVPADTVGKGRTSPKQATEASTKRCKNKPVSPNEAPSHAWQIVDGYIEPLYLDDSEDETDNSGATNRSGCGDDDDQDLGEVLSFSGVSPAPAPGWLQLRAGV